MIERCVFAYGKTHHPQKQLNRSQGCMTTALLQHPGSVPIKISTEELPPIYRAKITSAKIKYAVSFINTSAWEEMWIKAWHRKFLSITAVLSPHTGITYTAWQWQQHKQMKGQHNKTGSKTPRPNFCFLSFTETSTSCDLLNLLSSVSHQTLFLRKYTVWTYTSGKRKTRGRSTTDGTVSQYFPASSLSSISFGTCFPKIHIFTLKWYELELTFQDFVSSSSFNSSRLSSPVHWVYNRGIRPTEQEIKPSQPTCLSTMTGKKPPVKYFWTQKSSK